MLVIISLMITGIVIGRFIRNKENRFLQKIITWLIWILLFLLGVEVGVNRTVIAEFTSLGAEAFILTFFGLAGSILFTSILWYFVSKGNKKGGNA